MMSRSTLPIRITGGRVIDPLHGPTAIRDIYLAHGRVSAAPPADPAATSPPPATAADRIRTIDARGQLVMAGAIDMHTHVASGGVALARQLLPSLVPGARETAQAYCLMGYTTVIDAAVPVHEVDLAHDTLAAMDNVDTGFLLSVGSHSPLLHALDSAGPEAAVDVIEDLMVRSGAYGIKLVNPGLTDALDQTIPTTAVTPRELIAACAAAAERLHLAHPLHLHAPRLGLPGNVDTTIAMLQDLAGRRIHLAHAQFSAYGRARDGKYASGAARLAAYLASHDHVTADTGCVSFGPAMMISRDELLGQRLEKATAGNRQCRDGWTVMPLRYDPQNPVNALQWAMGLELLLASTDLTRLALCVDHPNGGSFTRIPQLLGLLADPQARAAELAAVHPWARRRSGLPGIERSLSDEQLVTITRIAPAKALGLARKGHLRPGADADVVIAPTVCAKPTIVIKAGRVVVDQGRIVDRTPGKLLAGVEAR